MEEVGIAYVLEKKSLTDNGETIVYYEIIDVACGFLVNFNDFGKRFISTSKNLGFILATNIKQGKDFSIANFKNIRELSNNNNGVIDVNAFMNDYKKDIGKVFSYNVLNDELEIILGDDLKRIKKTNEYDSKLLNNNNTDISKMYSKIKETIISQDEQIMQILTTIFKNQKVINCDLNKDMLIKLKENLIIYGPTGTGKTEILKRISDIYKVPIIIEDATSLSEIGYVGRNINDMLENLYLASGKNMELAQKGILVIDEFDKLAENNKLSKDHVSRIGVQRSLLKLLDGSTFYFDNHKFDTSKLSIIALGAFTDMVKNDDYSSITNSDFVNYGIMRELMGRFSKTVSMNPLTKEDIKKILLESDFSPINTYKILFDSMGIKFSYNDEFIDYVASKAIELNSGARGIKTVFDNIISGAMFRIFAGEYREIYLSSPSENEKVYVLKK